MGIAIYSVPDEIAHFIINQFQRFNIPEPHWLIVNECADVVISWVARSNYKPFSPEEAVRRYQSQPGLSEAEKHQFFPSIEYKLKTNATIRSHYDITSERFLDIIHLATWAALMWCWSEQGDVHVQWTYKTEIEPELSLRKTSRFDDHQFQIPALGL